MEDELLYTNVPLRDCMPSICADCVRILWHPSACKKYYTLRYGPEHYIIDCTGFLDYRELQKHG